MDWVHCNKCFVLSSSKYHFYLTNCGHIFCDKCVVDVKENKCYICQNICQTMLLSNNLNEDIKVYFSNPQRLLEQYLKVSQFQNNHRNKLYHHLREEYSKLWKKYLIKRNEVKELICKIKTMQKLNESLKQPMRYESYSESPYGSSTIGIGSNSKYSYIDRSIPNLFRVNENLSRISLNTRKS